MGAVRGLAGILLSLSPWTARAQSPPPRAPHDSQTVVFVREHGTVKSVVAMAYFTRLAHARRLPIRAISRGTRPDLSVPSLVQDGLRADGLALGPFTPTQFTPADLASAIAVISFDQPRVAGVVAERVPTTAWDGLPAVSENYRAAADAIRRRVTALVDSLATIQAVHRNPKRP
jgi:protein-tyrosine-phosphatase